jgi:site-specific recombinase XerC
MSKVAPTLESFFTDRLARQRQASPRTVASYRDALRLLVVFVHDRTNKAPSSLVGVQVIPYLVDETFK